MKNVTNTALAALFAIGLAIPASVASAAEHERHISFDEPAQSESTFPDGIYDGD